MKLIDSSAWVEFLRRKGDTAVKHHVARLLSVDQAAYTCPIRFELLSGAKPAEEDDLEQAFHLSHHFPFEQNDWNAGVACNLNHAAQVDFVVGHYALPPLEIAMIELHSTAVVQQGLDFRRQHGPVLRRTVVRMPR